MFRKHNNQKVLHACLSAVIIFLILTSLSAAGSQLQPQASGQASGCQPKWVAVDNEQGPSGYALKFNGMDNFVRVSNHSSLEPKTEMTIELWASIDGPQTYCTRLLRKAGDMQPGYYIAAAQSDRWMQVRFDGVANAGKTIRAMDNVEHTERVGSWHHFAGVYAQDYVAFYVDGKLIDKKPHEPGDLGHSPVDLFIGHGMVGNEYFKGMIDEVRIWNVARSPQEIQDNMSQSVPADSSGLAAYWKFDEGQGGIAHDSTRNQNHGTLENRFTASGRFKSIVENTSEEAADTFTYTKTVIAFNDMDEKEFFLYSGGKWNVKEGALLGSCQGGTEWATYKTAYNQISSVKIRGKIVSETPDVPSRKNCNFRLWIGPIHVVFNWEGANHNSFRNQTIVSIVSPHALRPGQLHDIEIKQIQDDVVVTVDKKEMYRTKAKLEGTVSFKSAWGSTIAIEELSIEGVPSPLAVVEAEKYDIPEQKPRTR